MGYPTLKCGKIVQNYVKSGVYLAGNMRYLSFVLKTLSFQFKGGGRREGEEGELMVRSLLLLAFQLSLNINYQFKI